MFRARSLESSYKGESHRITARVLALADVDVFGPASSTSLNDSVCRENSWSPVFHRDTYFLQQLKSLCEGKETSPNSTQYDTPLKLPLHDFYSIIY